MRECVTHHYACDCREQAAAEKLRACEAERDEALHALKLLHRETSDRENSDGMEFGGIVIAKAERDALAAEVARLRIALQVTLAWAETDVNHAAAYDDALNIMRTALAPPRDAGKESDRE